MLLATILANAEPGVTILQEVSEYDTRNFSKIKKTFSITIKCGLYKQSLPEEQRSEPLTS